MHPATTLERVPARRNPAARVVPFAPWPCFAPDEIEAATSVLKSARVNYWTGEQGRLFEQEFAAFVSAKYAVAVANGTVALELALHALGIGRRDEVIVPCRTFIASASCVAMRGAVPIFADVDPCSQNISADTIRPLLTPRTKAIIAVHIAGWPCDMDPIMEIARAYGLKVIEDCAQAHGAAYKGRPVGSLGDASAFSFCQDKIMTTAGEGGILTTNDNSTWRRAWSFRDHGTNYDLAHEAHSSAGFRWMRNSLGTNWRLTEIQSAIGRAQLQKIGAWLTLRSRNAAILTKAFLECPGLRAPQPSSATRHAYYKYYAFVQPESLRKGWDRDRIASTIASRGVPCSSGICSEIYLEKAFPPEMRPARRLPVARMLGENSLMFLVHPSLTEESLHFTCAVVEDVMKAASANFANT